MCLLYGSLGLSTLIKQDIKVDDKEFIKISPKTRLILDI